MKTNRKSTPRKAWKNEKSHGSLLIKCHLTSKLALDLRKAAGKKEQEKNQHKKFSKYSWSSKYIEQLIKWNSNIFKAFSCMYVCIFIVNSKSAHPTSTEVISEIISNVHLCTVNSSNEKTLTQVYLRKLNEGRSFWSTISNILLKGQGVPGHR